MRLSVPNSRLIALAACVLAGVAALASALSSDPAARTADDAVAFTRRALESVELALSVSDDPRRGEFRTEDADADGAPSPVWIVTASAGQRSLGLFVPLRGGEALNVEETPDQFLTDEQFEGLDSFSEDDESDDHDRRNVVGAVGLAVLAVAAAALAWALAGRRQVDKTAADTTATETADTTAADTDASVP